jgi:predicted amidohydrolase YtcJ
MLRLRLWKNADVTTLDASRPRASALVTAGPVVLDVGGEEMIGTWTSRAHEVIDLGGRSVIPGLTDSHIHFIDHGLAMRQVALESCRSALEVVDAVRRFPHGETGWIEGAGFQVNLWTDGSTPHRALLDEHFPERPVILHSRCFHQDWLNGAALRAAGISADTPDPPGGRIVRDEAGELTGLLQEEAVTLAARARPKPAEAALRQAIRDATEDLWSHGVVAVHEPDSRETLDLLGSLHQERALHMRVFFLPPISSAESLVASGLRCGLGDRWLRLGPLKAFLDGSLGSSTALMHEPYENDPGRSGIEVTPADDFRAMAEHAHAHGWRLGVHAIGDRAVDLAIDVMAESERRHGVRRDDPGIWDRIEHFQVFSPGAPERAARARIAAAMQPIHLFDDWRPADRLWGVRAKRAYACRSLLRAGVPVCLGSDAPVASANPFLCIHAAVRRTDLEDRPVGGWHAEEAVDVAAALAGYCAAPSRIAGEAAWRGRIAPGCAADFVALNADPWAPDVDWRKVDADLTVVDGAVVFDRHRERPERERPEHAEMPVELAR